MKDFAFEPLPNIRASEHIEKKIKEAILEGKFKPTDKLPTEKELAAQFGVSVVTVREALRALETIGLIEKKKGQRGGAFVCEIDNQAIKSSLGQFLSFKDLSPRHLLEVRRMIEPPIVKLAAQKITPEEIARLEENVTYCENRLRYGGQILSADTFYDVDKKNIHFHLLIAEATRNPILTLTLDYVLDFIWACEKEILVPDGKFSLDTVNSHRAILEFLKQRDAENCEKEMVSHLKGIDEALIEMEKKISHFSELSCSDDELKRKIRAL
jgi:GntR family transcriptional regulator, transcriptional repressor for pyruvate dehydrogenase complex